MPIFSLSKDIAFPPPELAEPDGLLALGGDLSPRRLVLAYRMGIFPWYAKDTPILWWSPDPRLVLFVDELHISHSLRRVLKKKRFHVTFNRAFARVIDACARVRIEQGEDTWLVPEMIEAYRRLHELGYAHSVETWLEDRLVGGLYGVAIGRVFFGESMFSIVSDASKVALVHLARRMAQCGYELIDCQVTTKHLKRFGAREIPRSRFLRLLDRLTAQPASPFWT
ncbi:leucyl/phenylalanyl-tRNA--protein transferase [Desulfacinum hydrothermale DSM 13146]|uniref:Leucyl/phenylalanyl-tRNA--protein transferase n=1 Tax=Desulfacinum hydrothermale DSM 13146 TaxID=1121390 RepID=A0A1W1X7X0_9BACT|nr:leucyl/phenylalanyl-tRNA--protein transferase [Desulfacinum hydrothermale]SMC20065.1 leucyl/phenylalanyl-tRNA--protein transferase [Desulfacinum hydrothermale DSM 13146]